MAADPVAGVHKLDGERLSLYVELNVAFRLMAEDADAVPQDESKVSLTGTAMAQPRAADIAYTIEQLLQLPS
jgi:hypothetical protein